MQATSSRAALAVLALCMLLALYIYPLFLDIPLFDPDEGLHAAIAQQMLESGDWITPRFREIPFLDKPPLYFWAQAASMRLFGMNEAAVRLPGALFAILGVITTAVVAGRLFDRQTGILAGFFQATLILPLALAQAGVHDVALVPLLSLAILGLWLALHAPTFGSKIPLVLGAGVMLGLACLTKGLLGMACVLITIAGYLIVCRRVTVSNVAAVATAVVLGVLVCAPWYVCMELRNPGYLHYYFVDRHIGGFLTSAQRHGHAPWWYYLPVLLGGGLPWIAYLPAGLRDWLSQRKRPEGCPMREPVWLLVVWLFAYSGFLCTAQSKLLTYLLPVFPPLSALVAVNWMRFATGRADAGAEKMAARAFRTSTLANPLFLPGAMLVLEHQFPVHYSPWLLIAGILVGISSWVLQRRCDFRHLPGMLIRAGAVLVAVFAFGMTFVVPPVANQLSGRELARYFNGRHELPPRLVISEARCGSMIFYLNPEIRRSIVHDQIFPLAAFRWTDELCTWPGAMLAVPERQMRAANRRVDMRGLDYEPLGRYRLYQAGQVGERIAGRAAPPDRVLR